MDEGKEVARLADMREVGTGTCYEDSASKLIGFDDTYVDWVLVHGRPRLTRPPFERYGHAWLERDFVVFDVAAGIAMLKSDYYRVGNIEDEERYTYTHTEARQMTVEHGHWGPWEGLESFDMSCSGEVMMGLEPGPGS